MVLAKTEEVKSMDHAIPVYDYAIEKCIRKLFMDETEKDRVRRLLTSITHVQNSLLREGILQEL